MAALSRIAIVHDCQGRSLRLQLEAVPGCGACALSAGCSSLTPSVPLQGIVTDLQAIPGARLMLRIDSAVLGRAALLGYIVPTFTMLAGAAFAGWAVRFTNDFAALAGAIAGLVLGGVLLRLYDARHGSRLWQVEPDLQDSGAAMR
jgi:positive regulator of sigma E activity